MKRALAVLVMIGCKPKPTTHEVTPRDAGVRDAVAAATTGWPELAAFPHVEPLHVVALPTKSTTPRFDVGGPALAGEIAVVSSSQFGFVAIDVHRGQIAWTKPAGLHVAPPLARPNGFVLIGDCLTPPAPGAIPEGQLVVGCVRVVTPTGGDQGYVAIHGHAKDLQEFAAELGPQHVTATGDHVVTWRRGERAIALDQVTGVATATTAGEPPIVVHYKDRTWEVSRRDDGIIVAMEKGHVGWRTERPYTELLGAVYLPGQSPMIRVSNVGRFGGRPEMNLMDMDATGSMHGQVAFPVPGIGVAAHAIDSVGDVAIAIQLDASLERDFIVGYAANALLMWVYPLPQVPRPDPIGLAIGPDVVVVFHDGDTVTILPELSAPSTAPGAARVPSENATP